VQYAKADMQFLKPRYILWYPFGNYVAEETAMLKSPHIWQVWLF
jgi:hypothetical protein